MGEIFRREQKLYLAVEAQEGEFGKKVLRF